ncbi:MAG: hypothetical protein KF829_10255 [Ferruginibacter sp.]|mgnify:CR=1 FL=1|nr:hypothetical protein [Ferruginibacter sp.]
MSTQQQRIERITQKVQEHLQQMAVLQREFEHQRKILQEMKQKQGILDEQVRLLKEQNQILRAATDGLANSDKKEFEKLINKYLRDIDKCIALLSE